MSKECACVYHDKGYCKKFSDDKYTSWCIEGPCKDRVPSIADRIRAMSDEELARWLLLFVKDQADVNNVTMEWADGAEEVLLEALQQPYQEDGA